MSCDWECHVCGEWASNRLIVGSPQTYWYGVWYCDEHAVDGCEKQDYGCGGAR